MKITMRQHYAAPIALLVGLLSVADHASPVTTTCTARKSISPHQKSSKTYLNLRSHGVNLARSATGVNWFKHEKDRSQNALIKATGFYQRTTSNQKIGRYFGINDRNTFAVATDGPSSTLSTIDGLDSLHINHQSTGVLASSTPGNAPGSESLKVFSLSIRSEQISYGLSLDYYQEWPEIHERFYTHISMPMVNVQNRIGLSSPDVSVKQNNTPGGFDLAFNPTRAQRFDNVVRYLSGQLFRPENPGGVAVIPGAALQSQQQLSYARIGDKSEITGIADIDAKCGWRLWRSNHCYASINAGITIPTGKRPDGLKLFEAVTGNGHHWALGLGGDFRYRLCGDEDAHVTFDAALDYRFLFAANERRTLGLCGYPSWGQYYLLGQKGNINLIPAANVTTTKVRVSPRDQLDGILALSCHKNNMTATAGYNVYYRHKEGVRVVDNGCGGGIPGGTYAVAARGLPPRIFGTAASDFDGGRMEYLTNDDLDTHVASTPSQVSHKFYMNLNYCFKDWEYPFGVGVGMHYEAGMRESAPSTWGVQFSAGYTF